MSFPPSRFWALFSDALQFKQHIPSYKLSMKIWVLYIFRQDKKFFEEPFAAYLHLACEPQLRALLRVCSTWLRVAERAGLPGAPGPCCRSLVARLSPLQPRAVLHDEPPVPVLSMCIMNGRNCQRTNHRQVRVITARCLIVVIRKHLVCASGNITVTGSLWILMDLSIVLNDD